MKEEVKLFRQTRKYLISVHVGFLEGFLCGVTSFVAVRYIDICRSEQINAKYFHSMYSASNTIHLMNSLVTVLLNINIIFPF